MSHPAWLLIGLGATLAAVGVAWLLLPHVPWLGRLPGDIAIEGEHTRLYFPITTCLLISLLLSGVMWAIRLLVK